MLPPLNALELRNISSSLAPANASLLPIYPSAMHPDSSRPDSLIRDRGLDMHGMPRNDLAGQLAYMTGSAAGAMVSKAWDMICTASSQAASVVDGAASLLTLPGADAASAPSGALNKAELLKKLKFSLDAKFQNSSNKTVQKHLDKIRANIIEEFEKAAKLGPKTLKHLQKCIEGVDSIEILDPTYSKTELKNFPNYRGIYDPYANVLMLISNFDGKYAISTILHECEHVRQTIEAKPVPALPDISECQKKLKTLLIRTVDCFDNPKKRDCEKVSELAQSYSDMPLVLVRQNKSGSIQKLTLPVTGRQTRKKAMKINIEHSKDNQFSVLHPEGTKDLKTGVRSHAASEEANMINMMWKLDQNQERTEGEINKRYAALPTPQILGEQSANRISEIPEKILEHACPEMLP